MYCSILTVIHPMLGVDIHQGTVGPPVPPAPMPHFVAQILGGLGFTAKKVTTVLSHNFPVVNQSSDIGMGIGHVAPNILFLIYVLTSSSTSTFGSFTVLSGNKPTGAAIAVYVNFNMNCAWPMNMPTGVVIAPGCNMVGLTPADIVLGSISMAVNFAISAAANQLGGLVAKGVMGAVASIAARISVSAGLMTAVLFAVPFSQKVIEECLGGVIGATTAGPTGALSDVITDGISEAVVPNYENGVLVNP